MNRISQVALAAVLALAACAQVAAQSRGRMAAPARVSSGARVVRVAPAGSVRFAGGRMFTANSTVFPLNFSSTGVFPVPGLGFDFAHLAAISRVRVSDFSVLTTAQKIALLRRLNPVVSSGFFPIFSSEPQVIVVQQPPVVVMPQAAEDTEEPVVRARPADRRERAAEAQPAPPVREAGEFVLVRMDGRVLFAAAYTVLGDQVTYVTPEGVRRSVALKDLDAEATERMNQERGTTLRLPA